MKLKTKIKINNLINVLYFIINFKFLTKLKLVKFLFYLKINNLKK
jgi:hypothetical protein